MFGCDFGVGKVIKKLNKEEEGKIKVKKKIKIIEKFGFWKKKCLLIYFFRLCKNMKY